eukprot:scaffold8079_cov267-Pinguiococcus_pyrenoidosus.AAC.5
MQSRQGPPSHSILLEQAIVDDIFLVHHLLRDEIHEVRGIGHRHDMRFLSLIPPASPVHPKNHAYANAPRQVAELCAFVAASS